MKIQPIFINFLAVKSLQIDNGPIENYCLEQKRISPGRTISNGGGGWQSNDLNMSAPELSELFRQIRYALGEVHRSFELNKMMQQVITDAWINVNRKGHFNYSHDHSGSLFSGVYYVKGGPDKGDLQFTTPITAQTYTISSELVGGYNAFTGHSMVVPPITGDLVIFPAWLQHRVNVSHSDEDRISIAFNSKAVKFT